MIPGSYPVSVVDPDAVMQSQHIQIARQMNLGEKKSHAKTLAGIT